MSGPPCPDCDRPLAAEALAAGWCPGCGSRVPEFVRASPGPTPPVAPAGGKPDRGWLELAVLVAVGGAAGVLLGMARHGKVSGAWAIVPVFVYAALVVGRWGELGRRRRPALGQGDSPRGGPGGPPAL